MWKAMRWCIPTMISFMQCCPAMATEYPVIKGEGRHAGQEFHTGLRHKPKELKGLGELHVQLADCENLPETFDLRDLGVVPPTRNQGSCGSCWSFSLTGSLESAIASQTGKILDLSEQELVSCDKSQYGCGGGLLNDFKYQINNGESLETDFPYTARDTRCKSGLKPAAKGVSFAYVGAANRYPTDKELKCALYKTHTIPWITVSASNSWGSAPSSYKTPYTRCGRGQTNHAVGVVGWYQANGKTQFIMRNSWGASWGDGGFMSLPLKCDSFGEEVAYIVTDQAPCKPAQVKLPAEISAVSGVEVVIAVREQSGVDYTWFEGEKEVGKGAVFYVTPTKETVYKLVGKNACSTAESSVRVKVIQAE